VAPTLLSALGLDGKSTINLGIARGKRNGRQRRAGGRENSMSRADGRVFADLHRFSKSVH
jgi:hypothetical protein